MSIESIVDRRRKRIVEHTIMYFTNAAEAIRFGNTVSSLVDTKFNCPVKYRCNIGAGDTTLAITKDYIGPTAIKTVFLEVMGNEKAQHICDIMRSALKNHNDVHHSTVKMDNEVIREKPQPQSLGFGPKRVAPKRQSFNLKIVR